MRTTIIEDYTQYEVQEKKNQEKFEEFIKTVDPELHMVYQALKQTETTASVVVEFIHELHNVVIEKRAHGKVWVDVVEGEPIFVRSERKILLKKLDNAE